MVSYSTFLLFDKFGKATYGNLVLPLSESAICTNQISGLTAAPTSLISDIDDAIDAFRAATFDIPEHVPKFSNCANLVERAYGTNEME